MAIDSKNASVGYGLVQPLRRISGRDFTAAGGPSLVKSSLNQILGTKPGELPWRPSFGLDVEKYRHRGMQDTSSKDMDATEAQQLGGEIDEALTRWDGRINVIECGVIKVGNTVTGRVRWTINNAPLNSSTLNGPFVEELPL